MNWLIYISGWFLGWAFWNSFLNFPNDKTDMNVYIKLVSWTMMWIWICWKFIS